MTPPGSNCSVQFGTGLTTAPPGTSQSVYLVVDDIEATRAELVGSGVDVGPVFHCATGFACRFGGDGYQGAGRRPGTGIAQLCLVRDVQ